MLILKGTKRHVKSVAFSPDGERLITVSNDHIARLYDTGTWQDRETLDWKIGSLKSVAVAADGSRAAGSAVSTYSGKIVIWDLD